MYNEANFLATKYRKACLRCYKTLVLAGKWRVWIQKKSERGLRKGREITTFPPHPRDLLIGSKTSTTHDIMKFFLTLLAVPLTLAAVGSRCDPGGLKEGTLTNDYGICLEVSDCHSRGGTTTNNNCKSDGSSIKCCTVMEKCGPWKDGDCMWDTSEKVCHSNFGTLIKGKWCKSRTKTELYAIVRR